MRNLGICYFRFKGEVKESQIYVEYRNFEKKEHKMDIKVFFRGRRKVILEDRSFLAYISIACIGVK